MIFLVLQSSYEGEVSYLTLVVVLLLCVVCVMCRFLAVPLIGLWSAKVAVSCSYSLVVICSLEVYRLDASIVPDLQIYGGPGSLSHDFKIWPITSKAVGPVDPSILVVKKSHLYKTFHCTRVYELHKTESTYRPSIQKKICLKQPLKKDKTKILLTNGSFMKVEKVAECSLCSILQSF